MTDENEPRELPELRTLARKALLEVTDESTVGGAVGVTDEGGGVVSYLFANRMPGYPGWRWTVSIAQVEGDDPTVLEVELMPGDGSLLAPEWVPWSERLAEYRAAQDGHDHESDDDDDESDEDESDEDESDDDESDDDDDESDDDDDEFDDDESDDDEDDDDDASDVDDEFDDDDFTDADEGDLAESDDDEIEGVDVDQLADHREPDHDEQ
ncbi:DUF3027 domain-containing protein [Curtobacterium sp. 9128]|uniref:DUF3027 domain-containing protein n=1 Tax=Curtobacterium sp. 9128 TaxID=1793722 RepID=UPI0021B476DF|nr:DUF3027 domain-containing protein [Curtobacterium sp. 9128]